MALSSTDKVEDVNIGESAYALVKGADQAEVDQQLLNVNKAVAVLNIVVGLLGLLIGIRSSAIVVAEGDAQRKA